MQFAPTQCSTCRHHTACTKRPPSWPGIARRRLSPICSLCPSSPGPLPPPPRCPHLVDDAGAGLPEADAVLGAGGGQEVVHLLVHLRAGRKASKSRNVRVAAQRVKHVSKAQQRSRPHGVGTPAWRQAQHRWNNGNSRPAASRRSISRTLLARSRSALPPNELSLRQRDGERMSGTLDRGAGTNGSRLQLRRQAFPPIARAFHACPALAALGASPVGLGGGGALNQVVAVDGGGHRGLGQARGNELQHRHLGGSILHRHAVCKASKGQRGAWSGMMLQLARHVLRRPLAAAARRRLPVSTLAAASAAAQLPTLQLADVSAAPPAACCAASSTAGGGGHPPGRRLR